MVALGGGLVTAITKDTNETQVHVRAMFYVRKCQALNLKDTNLAEWIDFPVCLTV